MLFWGLNLVLHILEKNSRTQFEKLAVTNQRCNPFNYESTTTTRLQEHNDKYIYKSVASLVQYISKDILSLQWTLSNEKGRLFQFIILIIRIIVIIVMIKRSLPS